MPTWEQSNTPTKFSPLSQPESNGFFGATVVVRPGLDATFNRPSQVLTTA